MSPMGKCLIGPIRHLPMMGICPPRWVYVAMGICRMGICRLTFFDTFPNGFHQKQLYIKSIYHYRDSSDYHYGRKFHRTCRKTPRGMEREDIT